MVTRRSWAGRLGLLATAALVVLGGAPALADPADSEPSPAAAAPAVQPTVVDSTAATALDIAGRIGQPDTAVHRVFIQLNGPAGIDISNRGQEAVKQVRAETAATVAQILEQARAIDPAAIKLFEVSNAIRGFGLATTSAALTEIADRDDVHSIQALVNKKPSSADAVELTGALRTWQSTGYFGNGIRLGVIDSGIDYTHANFGGPGTQQAADAGKQTGTVPWTPTRKVAGGFDFVGDSYDPTDPAHNTPQPDSNPMDCSGHGSAVASAIAGYGVTSDGRTYQAGYAALEASALNQMRIQPGSAPEATLFALRVFGCTSITDSVIPALDYSLDPDGDGDFSDMFDIVTVAAMPIEPLAGNDPDRMVLDRIAQAGVLPVLPAGNSGDVMVTPGSLGSSARALTVASSRDGLQRLDGLVVNEPASLRGIFAGQFSVSFPWAGSQPVTGKVQTLSGANADGCDQLSGPDAAAVAAKIAYLDWDDNDQTRRCGSDVRSANVAAVGGLGVILGSDKVVFSSGILGTSLIPVIRLTAAATERLTEAAKAGTLAVSLDPALGARVVDDQADIADTISTYSARYPAAADAVKPDLSAPGNAAASAAMGTGNQAAVWTGTSIAAGTAAGIAALTKQAHPTWTVEQLKADLINTAVHDVNLRGKVLDVQRAGAGRIDASAAGKNVTVAYGTDQPGAVGIAFGEIGVGADGPARTVIRTLQVANTGDVAHHFNGSYREMASQPGVTISLSPQAGTIKPGEKTEVTVTATIDPAALGVAGNPAQQAASLNPLTGATSATGAPVGFSGLIVLTVTDGAALRVPVSGITKQVSATSAAAARNGTLSLSGTGFSPGQGPGSAVAVLTYGGPGTMADTCAKGPRPGCVGPAGTLLQTGFGAGDGALWFGLVTAQPQTPVGTGPLPFALIDTNGDDTPDFEVTARRLPDTDFIQSVTVQLSTGRVVSAGPVNFGAGTPWQSSVVLLPVATAAIGMVGDSRAFPIRYRAGVYDVDTATVTDITAPVTVDVAHPPLQVAAPLLVDRGPATIEYRAPERTTALVLHLDAPVDTCVQLVKLPRRRG